MIIDVENISIVDGIGVQVVVRTDESMPTGRYENDPLVEIIVKKYLRTIKEIKGLRCIRMDVRGNQAQFSFVK